MVFFSFPSCHYNDQAVFFTLYFIVFLLLFFHKRNILLSYPSYEDRKTSDRFHLWLLSFCVWLQGWIFHVFYPFFLQFCQRKRNIHLKSHLDRQHRRNLWAVKGKAKSSPYWLQSLNNDRKSFRKIPVCHCVLS